jgi:hypothetical protein
VLDERVLDGIPHRPNSEFLENAFSLSLFTFFTRRDSNFEGCSCRVYIAKIGLSLSKRGQWRIGIVIVRVTFWLLASGYRSRSP